MKVESREWIRVKCKEEKEQEVEVEGEGYLYTKGRLRDRSVFQPRTELIRIE